MEPPVDPLAFQRKIYEFIEELNFTRKQYRTAQGEINSLTTRCHELERAIEKDRASFQTVEAGLKAALIDAQASRAEALSRATEEADRLRIQLSMMEQELLVSREQIRQLQVEVRSKQKKTEDLEQHFSRQSKQIQNILDEMKERDEEQENLLREVEMLRMAQEDLKKFTEFTEALAKESQHLALQAGASLKDMKLRFEEMQKEVVHLRSSRHFSKESEVSNDDNRAVIRTLEDKIEKLKNESDLLRQSVNEEKGELTKMAAALAESAKVLQKSDEEMVKLKQCLKQEEEKQKDLIMMKIKTEEEVGSLREELADKECILRALEAELKDARMVASKVSCPNPAGKCDLDRPRAVDDKCDIRLRNNAIICTSSSPESQSTLVTHFVPESQEMSGGSAGGGKQLLKSDEELFDVEDLPENCDEGLRRILWTKPNVVETLAVKVRCGSSKQADEGRENAMLHPPDSKKPKLDALEKMNEKENESDIHRENALHEHAREKRSLGVDTEESSHSCDSNPSTRIVTERRLSRLERHTSDPDSAEQSQSHCPQKEFAYDRVN